MYVLFWLNTVAAVQMFFMGHISVFFMTTILKGDRNINCHNPHCYFRLSKPILKILPIYRKNILLKQLSQAVCSKYVFRLLHAPRFQTFSTKLNMMVKVVKIFTVVL